MSSRTLTLSIAVGAVEAAGAVALVASSDYATHKEAFIAFALTAGVSFIASGLIAIQRRPENRTGVYLAAVGYLWFLGALGYANNPWLYAVGVILGGASFIPFTALVLAFPTGELASRFHRALPVMVGAVLIGLNTAFVLVTTRPPRGCDGCPSSPVAIVDWSAVADAIEIATPLLALIIGVAVIAIMVRRWRGASRALRRALAPVLFTGGVAIALIVAATLLNQASERWGQLVYIGFLAAFAAVPLMFLVGILRTRLARASAAGLLIALERGTPLREALAQALGDPSLEIAYWLDSRARWIDREGQVVPEPRAGATRAVTMIEHEGRRVGALLHDPTLAHEQELVGTVAAAAAISLRNDRLQAELRAQFELLETVVNTAPSLLVNVDTDGRIVTFNEAVVAATGLEPERILRTHFWDVFIDPREREAMIARFAEAAPDFAPDEYENDFTNARGERLVIVWRSAPIKEESGEVVGVVAGGIDITERKQREVELERARNATDTLVQTIPTLVAVVDEEGIVLSHEGRAGINRAFTRTLGWRDEEVGRRNFTDLVEPEDAERVRSAIASAAAGAPTAEQEGRWRRIDGSSITVAWTATLMPDPSTEGRKLVLLAATDVTDRKRYEEELRASRVRLVETADAERQRLERNLHDGAQQRLVSLSLTLRLAQSKLDGDDGGARELLTQAGDELALALDELRELARGIHPAVLTDRGLKMALRSLTARMPLPVEVHAPDERLPPSIEAGAYYVVSEALANVTKYAHASQAVVTVECVDGRVLIEVADDGVGGADPSRGTGLGGLGDRVAALDGSLSLVSPSGQGTRVRAEIPLEPSSDAVALAGQGRPI